MGSKQNIVGFDIAVNITVAMRELQRGRDLNGNGYGFLQTQTVFDALF